MEPDAIVWLEICHFRNREGFAGSRNFHFDARPGQIERGSLSVRGMGLRQKSETTQNRSKEDLLDDTNIPRRQKH